MIDWLDVVVGEPPNENDVEATDELSVAVDAPVGDVGSSTTSITTAGAPISMAPWPAEPSDVGVPADTVLSPWTGPTTFTVANQIIDGKQFGSGATIKAPGVVFTRCLFRMSSAWNSSPIQVVSGCVSFIDCEFDGANLNTGGQGFLGWTNFIVTRCYVHGSEDGLRPQQNCVIEDSWIGNLSSATASAHNDCIQLTGASSNVIIRRCNLVAPYRSENSAVFIKADQGNIVAPILVEDCRLSGGGYYIYVRNGASYKVTPNAVTIRNNTFVKGSTGFGGGSANDIEIPVISSGNVYDDGSHPVNGLAY